MDDESWNWLEVLGIHQISEVDDVELSKYNEHTVIVVESARSSSLA